MHLWPSPTCPGAGVLLCFAAIGRAVSSLERGAAIPRAAAGPLARPLAGRRLFSFCFRPRMGPAMFFPAFGRAFPSSDSESGRRPFRETSRGPPFLCFFFRTRWGPAVFFQSLSRAAVPFLFFVRPRWGPAVFFQPSAEESRRSRSAKRFRERPLALSRDLWRTTVPFLSVFAPTRYLRGLADTLHLSLSRNSPWGRNRHRKRVYTPPLGGVRAEGTPLQGRPDTFRG